MINSDAVLTDGEIRQQIIELLKAYHNKSDIAPTLSRIFDQMRVGRTRFDKQVDILTSDGRIELRTAGTAGHTYFRLVGSCAEWPTARTDVVMGVIKAVNDAGRAAKSADVAHMTNLSATDIKRGLNALQREGRTISVIAGPSQAAIYTGYIINRDEYKPLLAKYERKTPKEPELKEGESIAPHPVRNPRNIGTGISRREVMAAKARTKPGDVLPIVRRFASENTVFVSGRLTVKYTMPHICVFTNGESVKWHEVALHYRKGAPIPMEREGERCTI